MYRNSPHLSQSSTEESTRLDRFLLRRYPWLNKGLIEKFLRQKKILVNNQKARGKTRVNSQDKVDILMDLNKYKRDMPFVKQKIEITSEDIFLFKQMIVWENDEICVINKPHGLASQGGNNTKKHLDNISKAYNPQCRLVHRLDQHTSGVMVFAKTLATATYLGKKFQENAIHKIYLAIVEGVLDPLSGLIDTSIGKDLSQGKEKMVINAPHSKKSLTEYSIIKVLPDGYSLVELKPKTGRTHQLRVHMAYMGCPILGDKKYGAKKREKLHLHAYKIIIPMSTPLTFVAPLSDHIARTIEQYNIKLETVYDKYSTTNSC